jgi:hypothetical protein
VSRLWNGGQPQTGTPVATDTLHTVVIEIGFFYGLGVVIVFLAATALGRFSVIGLREATVAQPVVANETVPPAVAEQETTTLPAQETGRRRMADRERVREADREQMREADRERAAGDEV